MIDHAATAAILRERLATLNPLRIDIEDDSHHHAGHAGAREGSHFRLTIVTATFCGLNTLARHRLIHAAVGDLMHGRIHALAISALAPDEV